MAAVQRMSALLLALAFCGAASAVEPSCELSCDDFAPPASNGCCTSCEDFAAQQRPLCDWFGVRSGLEERGIKLSGRSTHFAFGVKDGINVAAPPAPFGRGDVFRYTGRGEYDATFDLEKFGGLPHGKLLVRAEHWYGEYGNVSLRTGSFSPPCFPQCCRRQPTTREICISPTSSSRSRCRKSS